MMVEKLREKVLCEFSSSKGFIENDKIMIMSDKEGYRIMQALQDNDREFFEAIKDIIYEAYYNKHILRKEEGNHERKN